MIIPTNEQCIRIIAEMIEMADASESELTDWEVDFANSNDYTVHFSTAQKEVLARCCEKYEFNCMK